jgi:hypothetical protein
MLDFYYTLALWILNIALPYLITRRDRRKLSEDRLARAWNTASWGSAVYFFGPFCLPAHFWITRRTARGLLQGCAWMVAVLASEWILGVLVEQVVGTS